MEYTNGNAIITIAQDGTRVIESSDTVLQLEQPLVLDIKWTNKCSNGLDEKGSILCSFCHEAATVNGKEGDWNLLKQILDPLKPGIELALGLNYINADLIEFLKWGKQKKFIINGTINQWHLNNIDNITLLNLLNSRLLNGLGISYRNSYIDSTWIYHPNVIWHVIAGIDSIDDILSKPFKKILVLGFKEFGFGKKSIKIQKSIIQWEKYIYKLLEKECLVSFDTLAVEQLDIKRFFNTNTWDILYQGDYGMYIDLPNEKYRPNSYSNECVDIHTMSLLTYFNTKLCQI